MRCITFDTNIDSRATGQYKKFNFNSMKKFGDQFIGTSPTGFHVFGGDTDIDDPIDASIKTGMTNLGYLGSKRLRHVYIGLETSGDLELELYADEALVGTKLIEAHKIKQQRIRLTIGSRGGKKGAYWAFRIKNKRGEAFAIDHIEILPVMRHRGHL